MGKAQREAPRAGRRGTRAWGNRLACSDALARPRRHAWDNGAVRQSGVAPYNITDGAVVLLFAVAVFLFMRGSRIAEAPSTWPTIGRPRGTLRLQCGCNRGRPPARVLLAAKGILDAGLLRGRVGLAVCIALSACLFFLPTLGRRFGGADHSRPRLPRCHGEGGGEPLQTRTRARDGRTGRRQGCPRYAPSREGLGVHAEGVAFAIDTLLQQVSGCLDEMEVGQERAREPPPFISVSGGSCPTAQKGRECPAPMVVLPVCVESALVGSLLEESGIPQARRADGATSACLPPPWR